MTLIIWQGKSTNGLLDFVVRATIVIFTAIAIGWMVSTSTVL